jgi:hypothetical protein
MFLVALCCLRLSSILKKLRLSSLSKQIEFVFHLNKNIIVFSFNCFGLPRLPGSGFKCNHIAGCVGYTLGCGGYTLGCGGYTLGCGGYTRSFTDNNTTPTKLFCFVLCCWLGCGNTGRTISILAMRCLYTDVSIIDILLKQAICGTQEA